MAVAVVPVAEVLRVDGENMNSYGMYIIGLALVLIFAGIFLR